MTVEDIGSKLRELRKNSGYKLWQLEHKTGYSPAHICSMERGEKISVYSLINVLDVYDYKLEIVKKEG